AVYAQRLQHTRFTLPVHLVRTRHVKPHTSHTSHHTQRPQHVNTPQPKLKRRAPDLPAALVPLRALLRTPIALTPRVTATISAPLSRSMRQRAGLPRTLASAAVCTALVIALIAFAHAPSAQAQVTHRYLCQITGAGSASTSATECDTNPNP